MKARDLMSPVPIVVTAGDMATYAAQLMRDANIGFLPVVEDLAHLHLTGVLTDRDLVVRCLAEGHPQDCAVRRHMTNGAGLAVVQEDAPLEEVMELMEHRQVRRVPVLKGTRIVGVIAQADLLLKAGIPLRVEQIIERISQPGA